MGKLISDVLVRSHNRNCILINVQWMQGMEEKIDRDQACENASQWIDLSYMLDGSNESDEQMVFIEYIERERSVPEQAP